MTAEDFLARLDSVKPTRRGWSFPCPAHSPDRHPSGTAAIGEDGRILMKCWAGCTAEEITTALGLRLKDLFANSNRSADEIRREQERREKKRTAEERQREQEGSRLDALRNADLLIRSARGIDSSRWSDAQLDAALHHLADAYALLREER